MLKVVAGLVPPSTGAAAVDGRALAGPRGGIGMAFQNATLLPWRTTLENVLLPLEVAAHERRTLPRERAAARERAHGAAATVGLAGFEGHAP